MKQTPLLLYHTVKMKVPFKRANILGEKNFDEIMRQTEHNEASTPDVPTLAH